MKIDDILIEKKECIRKALKQLEEVRCKVIYVVEQGKLVGSISDGDIRRYVLNNGNVDLEVSNIANKSPNFLNHYERDKIEEIFKNSELYSIPIVNYNQEIVEIIFRDGKRIKRDYKLEIPVVMMAGGKGTRLYPYTKILPKALVPIGDIPIAERILDGFKDFGCNQVYMIVNHKKEMIYSYFAGIEKKYEITYIEEKIPLGTGGGLYLLRDYVKETFFLINCDIIVDANYSEIWNYHKKEGNFITIVVAQYHQTIPYGVVKFDGGRKYLGMIEKPQKDYYISTGMYIVDKDLIYTMPEAQTLSFPDLIEYYKNQGKKIGVYTISESAYMDMGQLEELERMREKLNA